MTAGWLPLVLLDAVVAASFARCFTGPSELWLLVPVCVGAHLLGQLARQVGARRWPFLAGALWVVAVLLVAWVPVLALDWSSVAAGLPVGHGATVLGHQMSQAWTVFSSDVAPVPAMPGLVMAASWACGAMALAAEALDADAGLPGVVSLIPAFDVVLFTGTLGTPVGRPVELAALGALGVWYLAAVAGAGAGRRQHVVLARVEASGVAARVNDAALRHSGRPAPSGPAERRRAPRRGLGVVAPGVVLLAALGAGVVGPLLPGATSAPLVAWHGKLVRSGNGHGGGHGGNHTPVIVSSLVRVGEEEVDNTNAVLFTVHSSQLTREVLDVLDNFNGDVWSAAPLRHQPAQLPELTGSLSRLAANPPGITFVRGAGVLTQVLTIGDLGGDELPAAGPAIAAGGISPVEALSASGPLVDVQGLRRDESYSIESYVSPPPPSAGSPSLSSFASPATGALANRLQLVLSRNVHNKVLVPRRAPGDRATVVVASFVSGTNRPTYSDMAVDVDPSIDLRLPSPVPSSLVDLAHQIVAKATSPAEEAALIQQYLADNPSFHYHLPRRLKGGGISDPGEGYGPLLRFLFRTHTGYCQQYASAFAVLARIDRLPTRVVVGFLPGASVAADAWVVTGEQVHAWPQVYFPGTGWVDYEPTPGSPSPPTFVQGSGGSGVIRPGPSSSTPASRVGKGIGLSPGPGGSGPVLPPSPRIGSLVPARPGGGVTPVNVLEGILALLVLWAIGVPLARRLLGRRQARHPVTGVTASWRRTLRLLEAAGFHRRRAETHVEFARRIHLAGVLPANGDAALGSLVDRLDRVSFGPRMLTAKEVSAAAGEAAEVRRGMRRAVRRWQRLLLELDPRDLRRLG